MVSLKTLNHILPADEFVKVFSSEPPKMLYYGDAEHIPSDLKGLAVAYITVDHEKLSVVLDVDLRKG